MKTKTCGTFAVSILFMLTIAGLTPVPAHADDYRDIQNAIRRDIKAIHDDQAHTKALMHKKNDQLRHRDWRNARGTQERIDYVHMDLQRDRALLRADQRALARLRRP